MNNLEKYLISKRIKSIPSSNNLNSTNVFSFLNYILKHNKKIEDKEEMLKALIEVMPEAKIENFEIAYMSLPKTDEKHLVFHYSDGQYDFITFIESKIIWFVNTQVFNFKNV